MNMIVHLHTVRNRQSLMSGDDDGKRADTSGAGKSEADESRNEGILIDFHGAAIIDEDGHEIPITEDMIKDACKKLDPAAAEDAEDAES